MMNIGFVSVWQERGAGYVTKAYVDILKNKHNTFVYSRGNSIFEDNWNGVNITEGLRLNGTRINWTHISKWIEKNKIDIIFFNEQRELDIIKKIKSKYKKIKIGAYIDYYKEDTVNEHNVFDFLICNTKRHYSVFKWHPQCYYVPWGTDIELFKPCSINNNEIVFFHSAGLSTRKGTSLLYKAFVNGELYKKSKLLIHTQQPVEAYGFTKKNAENYNIEIVEKTITSPGLYYCGDVYVYPTMLDGLGLTIYEALASGLPVITTNEAPMNEIINQNIGSLVNVITRRCRWDAYYWPLVECEEKSLIEKMLYYVENYKSINNIKVNVRKYAVEKLNWKDREDEVNKIFETTQRLDGDLDKKLDLKKTLKQKTISIIINKSPDILLDKINKMISVIKR